MATPRHVNIAGLQFGPPHLHHSSGARLSEGQFTPYQEIALISDGTVMFKRNLPQPDGIVNAAGWPISANTGLVRW